MDKKISKKEKLPNKKLGVGEVINTSLSNTTLFLEKHWKGYLIEMIKMYGLIILFTLLLVLVFGVSVVLFIITGMGPAINIVGELNDLQSLVFASLGWLLILIVVFLPLLIVYLIATEAAEGTVYIRTDEIAKNIKPKAPFLSQTKQNIVPAAKFLVGMLFVLFAFAIPLIILGLLSFLTVGLFILLLIPFFILYLIITTPFITTFLILYPFEIMVKRNGLRTSLSNAWRTMRSNLLPSWCFSVVLLIITFAIQLFLLPLNIVITFLSLFIPVIGQILSLFVGLAVVILSSLFFVPFQYHFWRLLSH